ncbi:MAG TPA: hypothetical protein PKY81_01845 [bacterium]|nr:hypothetical protein [bacterium]HPN29677.1 hypothetical protein [bacterium]
MTLNSDETASNINNKINNIPKRKKKIKKKPFKVIWQRLKDRHPYVIRTFWIIILAIIIMILIETLFFYRKLYDPDFYKNTKSSLDLK